MKLFVWENESGKYAMASDGFGSVLQFIMLKNNARLHSFTATPLDDDMSKMKHEITFTTSKGSHYEFVNEYPLVQGDAFRI